MSEMGKIISVAPAAAIPGGEVEIRIEGIEPSSDWGMRCLFDGISARLVGSSRERIIATVPEGLEGFEVDVVVEGANGRTAAAKLRVGLEWATDLHLVSNPAVDPKDGSLVVTRSGSRGQKLPVTLFRLRGPGIIEEMSVDFLNPTGLAFSPAGKLLVSNRAEGEVCEVTPVGEVIPRASGLGVATGIAFDDDGRMFIGDRGGQIHLVGDFGASEPFATLEPSVSAYHMAFGPDGRLFVSAPGLSSFDSVHAVDRAGFNSNFFRGLGRPQGLAFDAAGNLWIAACHKGRRGVVKIAEDGSEAELAIAGGNVVGLCFGKEGEVFVATADKIYCLPLGIKGRLPK